MRRYVTVVCIMVWNMDHGPLVQRKGATATKKNKRVHCTVQHPAVVHQIYTLGHK